MRVLGIDPGYAIVGWGVIDYTANRFQVIAYGAKLALDTIDAFCEQYVREFETVSITDKKQIKKAIKAIESILKPKTPWYKKVWNWMKKPFVKK